MSPFGMNWLLFIGGLILTILALGVTVFALLYIIVWSIQHGFWHWFAVIIGCILFFVGLIIQIWKEP